MTYTKDATGSPIVKGIPDDCICRYHSDWGFAVVTVQSKTQLADICFPGITLDASHLAKIIEHFEKRLKEVDMPQESKKSVEFELVLSNNDTNINISAPRSDNFHFFVLSVAADIIGITDLSATVKPKEEDAYAYLGREIK